MRLLRAKPHLALLFLFGLSTTLALGQTTGEIKGEVKDDKGEPLPGVLATARGPALPGERPGSTDRHGRFQIPLLPPGSYSIKFSLEGHQTTELTDITVQLGASTSVEVTLKSGEVAETISVTAPPPPLIDIASTDNIVNLGSRELDAIPTAARDYREITNYSPSVTGVEVNTVSGRANGFPSIRGEGQYGDNYMIDGLTVREPQDNTTATPLPYDAIEEIQIITDGFAPEYGQALGGAVNVITKSGTHRLSGEVAYLYTSDALSADFDPTFLATPTSFDRSTPYVNFGGPLGTDKLRFFLSYNRADTSDTYAETSIPGFGTLPEGLEETESNTYFGKLTWALTPNHNVSLNYTYRDGNTTGLGSSIATPEARSNLDVEDSRWRLNYQAIFSARSVLEARLGSVDRTTTNIPVSPRDAAQYDLTSFGVLTNNAFSTTLFETERKDAALIYTHYLSAGRHGSHEIKGGVEYHEPKQTSTFQFTGTGEDVFSISPPSAPDPGAADRFDGGSKYNFRAVDIMGQTILVPSTLNEYQDATALPNRTEEFALFIQDRWEVGRWNFLFGLRADRAKGLNNEDDVFFEYDFGKALAPRFSLSWDVTGDGKNVIKAGWGRFSDTASTRFGEFANTQLSFAFRAYDWIGGDTEDFMSHIDDGGSFDIHDPGNWGFGHEQSNSATPSNYGGVTEPAHVDRLLLEYGRRLGANYAIKARYVNGMSRDLIDDVFEPFPSFTVTNTDLKVRNYYAYELEFNGNPTPNFSFRTSYVHSAARGTSPGQFELGGFQSVVGSGNDVGVFLDRPRPDPKAWCRIFDDTSTPAVECVPSSSVNDPTMDFDGDDDVDQFDQDLFFQNLFGGLGSVDGNIEGWYGDLPYSIDDQVKLSGRLDLPKAGGIYLTGFLHWASGYHTQRRGFQGAYGGYQTFSEVPTLGTQCADPDNPTFATCSPVSTKTPVAGQSFGQEDGENRGIRENNAFWKLDMSVGKAWALGQRMTIDGRVELFNLFNNQEALTINDQAVSTFGEPFTRQSPRSTRLFVRFGW